MPAASGPLCTGSCSRATALCVPSWIIQAAQGSGAHRSQALAQAFLAVSPTAEQPRPHSDTSKAPTPRPHLPLSGCPEALAASTEDPLVVSSGRHQGDPGASSHRAEAMWAGGVEPDPPLHLSSSPRPRGTQLEVTQEGSSQRSPPDGGDSRALQGLESCPPLPMLPWGAPPP